MHSLPRLWLWVGLAGLSLACSGESSPEPTPDPVATKPADAQAAEPAPEPEPAPLPEGAATPGYPTVAIVGFGVRFQLNPPFQAAVMPGQIEAGNDHTMYVSWWDVGAENAGRHGRVGLYNVGVLPKPVPDGENAIQHDVFEHRGGKNHRLRLGDSGTELRLPKGINALGGMGSVSPGPALSEWKVQVGDAEPVAWPEKTLLHSWDPASGSPIHFDAIPKQPYGPWPTPAASPVATPKAGASTSD